MFGGLNICVFVILIKGGTAYDYNEQKKQMLNYSSFDSAYLTDNSCGGVLKWKIKGG